MEESTQAPQRVTDKIKSPTEAIYNWDDLGKGAHGHFGNLSANGLAEYIYNGSFELLK